MAGLYRWQYDADTPGALIGHQWHVRPSHWLKQTQNTLWCKWLVITTNNDLNFLCHHKSFLFHQIVFNSRQFSPQIFPTPLRARGIVWRGGIYSRTFQIISFLQSHNPPSSRDTIITINFCTILYYIVLYCTVLQERGYVSTLWVTTSGRWFAPSRCSPGSLTARGIMTMITIIRIMILLIIIGAATTLSTSSWARDSCPAQPLPLTS